MDVSSLLRQHASALLLIEKNNRAGAKTFAARGGCGSLRIRLAQLRSSPGTLELGVESAIEQQQESKSRGRDCASLSRPRVVVFAGWIVQPVSGEGKRLAQSLQVGIAGIAVAVEAEIGCA